MSEVEYAAPFQTWLAFLKTVQGEEAAQGWPLNSTSNVLEKSRVVKSGAGRCFGFTAFNNKNAAQFILVFDKGEVPANGEVPVCSFAAATVANVGAFWGDVGRFFNRGIVICNSSTVDTLTIGSADCLFDAQYV